MATSRIYLVDDDKFLLDMYAVKFKNAGHEVSVFQNGEEVLNVLRTKDAPDAILLDIMMPSMTGFEVLQTIRTENLATKTKIIILTNQGQDHDLDQAKELKADGYIIKASSIPAEVYAKTMELIGQAV